MAEGDGGGVMEEKAGWRRGRRGNDGRKGRMAEGDGGGMMEERVGWRKRKAGMMDERAGWRRGRRGRGGSDGMGLCLFYGY